ncbi:helix-turn-helix domain-containing protein [Streptacidiphilus pinicola]|uniref:helix-turn-helix domain-containing protein n=1 Tax=Streptacidiphilus pinicola TaxID=2219663 RepID=UPI0014026408|nr:XRE family transcriptional regulator [Streptacidiphilus pinicola]
MRANWRPIPDHVCGDYRRLTLELRAIKDRSGLSLTQIGARTHYSKASWERWFNGKRLITEHALESLAITVDENARLLKPLLEQALREAEGAAAAEPGTPGVGLAEHVPPQATAPALESLAEAEDAPPLTVVGREPATPRPESRRRHLRTALVSVCSALVGAAVGAYVAAPGSGESGSTGQSVVSHPPVTAASFAAPCAGIGCAGKDPQSTGCVKDDRTLITDHVGTIIIYLHYSARCHAAWGALTNAEPGDFATIITTNGDQEKALVHWGYDNYSMMVDASDPSIGLKVCGVPLAHQRDSVCTPELNAPAS